MSEFEEVCQLFKEQSDLDFVLPAGRANTLLYAFFKTLPSKSKVLFPAIMCPSPLFVAELAGVEAQLCDVDPRTGLLDFDAVKSIVLSNPKEIKAVLSVNLYGLRPDNGKLYEFCRSHDVYLIEDAAQGWDFDSLSKNVDFSLLSFGSTKTIDIGGGGLLLTKDQELFKAVSAELAKVTFSDVTTRNKLSLHYSKLYYLFQEMESDLPGSQKNFASFASLFAELYFPAKNSLNFKSLLCRLSQMQIDKDKRLHWIRRYHAIFEKNNHFTLLDNLDSSGDFWRYSVLITHQNRDAFTDYLRARDIDVSCWYPSLEKLGFNTLYLTRKQHTFFGESVLNFWLTDMTNKKFNHIEMTIQTYFESDDE